jgi:DNA-binding response OmpR family regulator
MQFSLGQQRVPLAPTQFRLLLHLYRHAGVICTRESCVHAIWGDDYISLPGLQAETLDRAINILRNKLRELDPLVDLIKTFPGVGYELTASP